MPHPLYRKDQCHIIYPVAPDQTVAGRFLVLKQLSLVQFISAVIGYKLNFIHES